MGKLSEKTTVRMTPTDYALACELGRRRAMDTPTLLRTLAAEAARNALPAEVVERIERRFGGGNDHS